ncbi:ATP-binding cassette domain-containing protein [Sphingomonas sanxanigenens]|uniref:ABC transporter domain-containing protein n=1 Tax=Sphingomonas sanxanigenens DSM 19645 = NX02 TaxID=1123269 RepID=W0A4T1_9SPHN|nr:ATP-binding cassette domain-containing protein [Sphingomonas sanxanigenens]AHE52026.1 hypothetical protein NX02_01300 [Sphingomonas sanxanigenens DSM 19645 = NX02]
MSRSASITVANLGWSTPDGEPVLTGLDLSFTRERCGIVGRNGVGKSTLLRLIAGQLQPATGAVAVTGTVETLRQIVQVRPDETVADLFGIADGLALLAAAEAGTASIAALAEADWTLEARLESALARVGLTAHAATPLASLSGGQRTRAALAAALFAEPDFLLLDEPTNNLDAEGRTALHAVLAEWRAGAIIVSHDRALLETMDAIVELTALGATRYGGNFSHYRARKAIELAAADHDVAVADRQRAEVDRKAQVARERKQRRDAAGARKGARGDMPKIVIGARRERAEKSGGSGARLAERLALEAGAAAGAARAKVEQLETLKVVLPPTGLAPDRRVLDIAGLRFGHDIRVPLIEGLSLSMVGPERIALTGANGSGKTSLLHLIAGGLTPWDGSVRRHVRMALLDQTAAMLDPTLSILDNFRALNPHADDNRSRAALARFQFRAEMALRRVGTLSGGQLLRAALAALLGAEPLPELLLLDEPTNHLDLESVEAIEAGLAAYDGALIVVSHDERFLDAIGITRRVGMG